MNKRANIEGSLEDQEDALLQYLQNHSAFAANKFLGINGVETRNQQWHRLSEILNSIGPKKTVAAWMRYWTELKRKARVYNAKKNQAMRKTGNDSEQLYDYNEKFERIIQILGTSHKNGLPLVPEIGVYVPVFQKTKPSLMSSSSTAYIPDTRTETGICGPIPAIMSDKSPSHQRFNSTMSAQMQDAQVPPTHMRTSSLITISTTGQNKGQNTYMTHKSWYDAQVNSPTKALVGCDEGSTALQVEAEIQTTGSSAAGVINGVTNFESIVQSYDSDCKSQDLDHDKIIENEDDSVYIIMQEDNTVLTELKESVNGYSNSFNTQSSAVKDFQVNVLSLLSSISQNLSDSS